MQDFRVHSLDAKYVGPFEHLYIEFKEKPETHKDEAEVHIFTGENGTGKSTILYLLACYPDTAFIMPRIHADHLSDFLVTVRHSNDIPSVSSTKLFATVVVSKTGASIVDSLKNGVLANYHTNNKFRDPKYSFAFFAYSGYRKINDPKLESISEIIEHPLADALNFHSSSNPDLFLRWIANNKTEEALAMLNKNEERASKYSSAITKVQQAISNIVGSSIEFELVGGPLNVFVKWDNIRMTFEVLPDGLKSIISWLGNLLMRMYRMDWETEADIFDRNFILFLDEIDIHLHPAWQRKILPVVKKLFKNAQIFISTHSPFVVGSVDGAWVYKLKKEGQFAVLDGEPILSNDARSYQTILDDVFGIKDDFGVNIEKKFDEFYDLRTEILEGKRKLTDKKFQKLVKELAPQSIEVESIISMELRQLERITKSKQLQKTT